MIRGVRWFVSAWLCCGLLAAPALAQDDVTARARVAAEDGRRGEGLALLERHLAAAPHDLDARLVYGLILSWDAQYDAARAALRAVLAQAPDYLDARVALMNVEWWSGRLDEARVLTRGVLARDPGNTQARLVQQRLDARTRPWSARVTFARDTFDDRRDPWQETALTIGRETPVGTVLLRGSQADRFGLEDRQVDVEFYPVFRAGTYAFIGAGASESDLLYPGRRYGAELYQSLGGGFEVSAGFRQLDFAQAATLYVGSLTKYAGNWMLSVKATAAPDDELGTAWSYHGSIRRYFGAAGTSFIGIGYGHGFAREEPRGAGDLVRLDADTVRAQAEIDLAERLRLSVHGSHSRQERALSTPVRQTTAGAGLVIRF